jgi:RNA polymerase primary sigma factor
MDKIQKQLREKLQDDVADLSKPLQKLLESGLKDGSITEEDIIAEIDDMDAKIKMLEKFYDLADKLSIKVITIEENLAKELAVEPKKERKLGKVEMYEKKYRVNDKQFKDFIKLYFNDIGQIPLLNAEEERDIARRIKK